MPDFGSPFSGLANGRRLTEPELVRAIRFMVAAEYEGFYRSHGFKRVALL